MKNLGKIINPIGDWVAGTHKAGTIARYQSASYIALKDTSATPTTQTDWMMIATDGQGSQSVQYAEIPTSVQLFDKLKLTSGSIDSATGTTSGGTGKYTSIFGLERNTDYTFSGFGNSHYPLNGVFYKNGVKVGGQYDYITVASNLTSKTFKTLDVDFDEVKFLVKSTSGTDNTDVNNLMLNKGTDAIAVVPYTFTKVVKSIGGEIVQQPYKMAEMPFDLVRQYAMRQNSFYKVKGLKTVFIGDSITFASHWVNEFKRIFTTTVNTNYAANSKKIVGTGDNELNSQVDKLIAAYPNSSDVELIMVAIGTNDYSASTLGDLQTAFGKTIATLDLNIVAEAARAAFYKLREKYPNAMIFYMLPLQRATAPNSATPQVWALNDLMRKVCAMMGVPVIDQFAESGIMMDFEVAGAAGRDLSDGLHPHAQGGIKQGRYIARKVFEWVALNIHI